MSNNTIANLHYQLNTLLTTLPVENSYRSSSELNSVLSKYLRILDYVNSYNENYKSVTTIYYTDITNIRDNIEQLSYAASQREKDKAFESARNELKSDLKALAMLIQPKEELVT